MSELAWWGLGGAAFSLVASYAAFENNKQPTEFTIEGIHGVFNTESACDPAAYRVCVIKTDKGEFVAGGLNTLMYEQDPFETGATYSAETFERISFTESRDLILTLKRK